MGVAMTSLDIQNTTVSQKNLNLISYFHDPDKLLNTEEGNNATEHSQSNRHIMRVMSTISTMAANSVNKKSIKISINYSLRETF